MTGKAGVWIDHRNALIVAISPSGEHTTRVVSKVEKHPERGGDWPLQGSYDVDQVPADNSRQRALTGELDIYYDAVIEALRGFDSLFIFGPGEAKGELNRRLASVKLAERVTAVETADKMTDPQLVAKVRTHFGVAAPRTR
jgi:hypothetical protein